VKKKTYHTPEFIGMGQPSEFIYTLVAIGCTIVIGFLLFAGVFYSVSGADYSNSYIRYEEGL